MHNDEEPSFFDRERDKLAKEITLGFEELLSSSNVANRKLEEVLGMTKEYDTIASLWHSFYKLMNESGGDTSQGHDNEVHGLPGTGGHVIASTSRKSESGQ
ncbi:hypothetical protein PC9H_011058 [Pleurotus ostreatus]|uniref:DASH complex subunit DAD1 n=2 Tax=Pleurotus TaxID=5320 RepID=A0A8H7DP93_PLEOS|nr:uncharacterized protein PC9H_011058 [Pleurotus ostreatus]KAF7422894.1 hypothetical protein PC9H_011058 [Pleurotus ostreatus]KAG9227258.1 hypothetical protein CCMSSC00406_0004203 [Pleurotus cornucopiae]KAJ8691140.1 Dolichyl-diphosphooligosaccharide-protein glycosyltransferase subunit dad1 [Pleurotus ostreatus]